jgi:glycosyltransferase involved in cell wall biosynthesis
MPKVSVVLPVYNGERFIGAAIQSVLDQTFRDFELVVVDDGSTDNTGTIVHGLKGPLIYHRQENQGAGAARNAGVALAQGEWIAFMDADDIWDTRKLSTQFEYLEKHPNASFVHCDMDLIDSEGNLIEEGFLSAAVARRKRRGRRNLVSLAFDDQPFPYPSTVMCKRELFLRTGGFNPRFGKNYHEDFELFARMAHISPIHFMPQNLVRYRQGKRNEERWNRNWQILLDCLLQLWRDDPERLAAVNRYTAYHWSNQGKRFLRSGDYKKARQYFRRAFSQYPFYWGNLRRWALSYLIGLRVLYSRRKTKRVNRKAPCETGD